MDHLNLQADTSLLLCLARTELDPYCEARARQEIEKGIEWLDLLRLAASHGVLPVLNKSLKSLEDGSVPGDILDRLNRVYYSTVARNLAQVKELSRVQKLFDAKAIPFIAFKGPILAQHAYRNLGLRGATDLDILIPKEAFAEAQPVLLEHGYRLFEQIERRSWIGRILKRRISGQIPFVNYEEQVSLDVHTDIMPPGYSYTTDFDALLRRSQPVPVGSGAFPGFCSEDLLQILCFHGAKNRWEFLKYGCDVAELIRATPEMDWEGVREHARRMRSERVLHIGLIVAHELFGAPLPEDVIVEIRKDRAANHTFGQVAENLRVRRVERLSYSERFRFNLAIQDTLLNKARYCAYALVKRLSLDTV